MLKRIKYQFIIIALLFTATPGMADNQKYRILLTNDDGIHAAGLHALIDALKTDYEIIVAAPVKKWGGKGHATLLWENPIKVEEIALPSKVKAYAVHALPADAARFGIIQQREINQPIDLIISGVNHGENLGSLSHLSGTVGAAMEGPYYGIPAIAVSIEKRAASNNQFAATTEAIKSLVKQIQRNGLPKGTVLNVNVPENAKGMRIAPMDGVNVSVDNFEIVDSAYKPVFSYPNAQMKYSDMTVYSEGYIAVTPINIDWTDRQALKQMMINWDIK
ncbi:5'/3'-nucleotidase SurE [Dasania sp. GY-MA-18]|uniref:5'-nucleotidase SurE n=1 Tax=Dasania phycosphaerae TaxID=2950436 RepID=A0A9J6RIT0_9GAMM|nr:MULTISPECIES: 5'/3'-nucleotidase SurE [Dasania]MCR8921854.1 5'/3'-nucleotidase SurE [Dasania sp. GY-MA-18]MCZ0864282.1 5'/3'-nucleotidase SurE [Dasania phycosphaerae]MCZ0868010.1 5'/3'-nucleotidase SurE [Dasania phycosphaerae]